MRNTNKDIVFIINPHSGKKKPESLVKNLKKIDSSFAIFVSNTIDEFDIFIKENIDKYKVFVIAGGDGTINYFAQQVFSKNDKAIAIIPLGSGNGFARELGFRIPLKKLIDTIYAGETIDVDVMELNNKKFINAAGIGFDSCVAHLFALRKRRGLTGYFFTTLKCLRQFKNLRAKISFDGKVIEGKFKMISFANTRQFGNNALIAPKARPNSGKLDIVLVKPFPILYYPIFLINMFTGRLKDSKYISYYQVESDLTIHSSFTKYHIDGDPIEFNETSILKIHKGAIRVIRTSKAKI